MFRRIASIGAVAAVLVFSAATPRADAAPDPRSFVQTLGTQGIQMMGPSVPLAQRTARFRELFQSDFDVAGIGRFALGRYWQQLQPAQQQEFLTLFQEYTVAAYSERLGQYGGAQFNVIGVSNQGGETVVTSTVERAHGGQPVQIAWHLVDQGGQLKISDVDVDGVSMRTTQREEFAKIIENNGGRPDALLAVMRQKLGEQRS
jgi:phospholipid transport system substrate-binding protein